MQSFLQLVAHDLYAKIGNDLSRPTDLVSCRNEYQRPVQEVICTESG